jgi:hypothetical protein
VQRKWYDDNASKLRLYSGELTVFGRSNGSINSNAGQARCVQISREDDPQYLLWAWLLADVCHLGTPRRARASTIMS